GNEGVPPSMYVYSAESTGNVAPIATISTFLTTGLSHPQGIAVDSSDNMYVAGLTIDAEGIVTGGSVLVYSAGSNGNTAPIATISGSSTGLDNPVGIAVDSSGKIYVADAAAVSVLVYSAASTGNVAPIATISG